MFLLSPLDQGKRIDDRLYYNKQDQLYWLIVGASFMKGGAHMAVQVNSPAPAFELSGIVGKSFRKVRLSDYKGKWIVLFFYPLDFTPV